MESVVENGRTPFASYAAGTDATRTNRKVMIANVFVASSERAGRRESARGREGAT